MDIKGIKYVYLFRMTRFNYFMDCIGEHVDIMI